MNESSTQEEETAGPRGGERLRAARRSRDISVRDIAKELHLDEPKVRALEENRFDALGAPVFAKGHMRKYAELVGVPVDDILADYYEMNRSAGAPPIVGPTRARQREFLPGPWLIGGVLLILVAAAAYWWLTQGLPGGVGVPAGAPAAAPFATQVTESASGDTDAAADSLPQMPDAAALPAEPPVGADAGDTAPVTSAPLITEPITEESDSLVPQVSIELRYSGDCWTEVSDASGSRLFYDLGSAGRVVNISGDAPLRLILGDSNNATIIVEGQEFAIPNSARRGRLARLTINRP
jgi:cytoskeleton protein RodZ